jgi:hypothetical protein
MASLRSEVLTLYRRVLRISRTWSSKDPCDTQTDRKYICREARTLIERNRHLKSDEEIRLRIQEAEARIGIAVHYSNPYPRPVNLPQSQLPPGKTKYKSRERIVGLSKPIYIKSYDDK